MLSTSTTHSQDHLPPSEQLCYVYCTICDTFLTMSVPNTSLFKSVTISCGHCTNLILPVNMCGLLLLSSPIQFHLGHSSFSPSHNNLIQEEMPNLTPNDFSMPARTVADDDELPRRPPIINRPPEKRQKVPTPYNRFISDEIQRIKSLNPDITHREAFSAAAKNWAYFRHNHFGLIPDQTMKKTTNVCQHEGDEVLMNFAYANVGVSLY